MLHKSRTSSSNSKSYSPFTSETFLVVAILLVFQSLSSIEASKLPLFLDAEDLLISPDANFHFGQGLKSSAWFAQLKDEFWAGYLPPYSLLLYLWIQIFRFCRSVARSLNYLLAGLSAFILWKTVVRLNLITLAIWRVFLLILLLVVFGYGFDFRPGQSDVLMITLSVTALLAYSIPIKHLRCLCLTCIYAVFPFSDLGLVTYTVIFRSLVLIYLRWSFLKKYIAIIAGLEVGSFGLFSFYFMHGAWKGFVTSVLTNPSLSLPDSKGTPLDRLLLNVSLALADNRSFKWLLISAVAIAIYKLTKGEFKFYSLASFEVAVGFGVPFAM